MNTAMAATAWSNGNPLELFWPAVANRAFLRQYPSAQPASRRAAAGAISSASTVLMRPEMSARPPPISLRITGAVTTSPLPFSMAKWPSAADVFARDVLKMRAPSMPRQIRQRLPGFAGIQTQAGHGQTVTRQHHLFLTSGGAAALVIKPLPSGGCRPVRLPARRRIVKPCGFPASPCGPDILALAVSCTPGNCNAVARLVADITGSATPVG